jgi:hypothetical protein
VITSDRFMHRYTLIPKFFEEDSSLHNIFVILVGQVIADWVVLKKPGQLLQSARQLSVAVMLLPSTGCVVPQAEQLLEACIWP